MSSMAETFQKRSFFPSKPTNQSLPVSQTANPSSKSSKPAIRRRLSSISQSFQKPISDYSSPASEWVIRKSKSMSSYGEFAGSSVRKWWDWGWSWILSTKPTFAQDLEMNEEESALLGYHNKGTLTHVFYKVKYELRRMMNNTKSVGSPQGFKYDSYNYAQNFDKGIKKCQS